MTSGLQMTAGGVLADMAIVAVPANGKIDITMSGGLAGSHTDVVGDVIGYFTAGTGGSKYHAVNATRVLDTRQDNAPVVAYGVRSSGCGNVVADDATLILNLDVTQGDPGASASPTRPAPPHPGRPPSTGTPVRRSRH